MRWCQLLAQSVTAMGWKIQERSGGGSATARGSENKQILTLNVMEKIGLVRVEGGVLQTSCLSPERVKAQRCGVIVLCGENRRWWCGDIDP